MEKYKIRESVPESISGELADHPEVLRGLLYHRGISTRKDAEEFLNPDYEKHSHDPFLLAGMGRAVERILKAVSDNERVAIYSDYDADGIPGGIILHDFFKKISFNNFQNYIPHRNTEGFGMNLPAIEKLAADDVKLIITVDCGISDVKAVARAEELGMDVIITDHHLPNSKVPDAYAIVNPNQEDDRYPNKSLCGSGVAYKLVQALIKELSDSPPDGWEKWLLDMVGIATISDMVPLTGENRALAHFGLKVLRKSPRQGLKALLSTINVRQNELTEDDVAFMLSPRINAASRMDRPEEAFRTLATNDISEARSLASHLDRTNNERKGAVASMIREIRKHIREKKEIPQVIVIGNPHWKPGLLGLAANALVEEHKKPVFLWGAGDERVLRGSCRSDGSVDLGAIMEKTNDIFAVCGGHRFSGGFSVLRDKVSFLEEKLNTAYNTVSKEKIDDEAFVDAQMQLSDFTWDTFNAVQQLAPFGVGNPKPLFLLKEVLVKGVRFFGKNSNHLEIVMDDGNGNRVRAVRFFAGKNNGPFAAKEGNKIDLVGSLDKNSFNGSSELRLRIADILTNP